MSINAGTIYEIYVFFGENEWTNEFFWRKLITALHPLSQLSSYLPALQPSIYNNDSGEYLPFDSLSFSEADLRKWLPTDKLETELRKVKIFYPSMDESVEKGITPEIGLIVSGKPSPKESRYKTALALIIKDDLWKQLGENEQQAVLRQLHQHTKARFVVYKQRPWGYQQNGLSYTDGLQNFFPSAVLAKGDDFTFSQKEQDWQQLINTNLQ